MKSKAILRKKKEFKELQKKDVKTISSRAANLNSFRLIKVGKANLKKYSYVVPWQIDN